MGDRNLLTKILAIAGTFFVWVPLLAPLVFGVFHFFRAGWFQVDYLMPAEMFPAVLVGAGLLIWAAIRARSRRLLILGGFGAAVALLFGAQALAEVTGLADGAMEPTGIWWALVVATFALYIVALIAVGVGGALLLRDVFGKGQQQAAG